MIAALSLPSLQSCAVAARPHRTSLRLGLCLVLAQVGSPMLAQVAPGWAELAPLFVERCVNCHSGEHAAAGLHLDSYAGALAGSENGPVLVPSEASGSEMIRRLRGESQPRMPFLSRPLGADEIALIERWIEAGLPEVGALKPEPEPLRAAVPATRHPE